MSESARAYRPMPPAVLISASHTHPAFAREYTDAKPEQAISSSSAAIASLTGAPVGKMTMLTSRPASSNQPCSSAYSAGIPTVETRTPTFRVSNFFSPADGESAPPEAAGAPEDAAPGLPQPANTPTIKAAARSRLITFLTLSFMCILLFSFSFPAFWGRFLLCPYVTFFRAFKPSIFWCLFFFC